MNYLGWLSRHKGFTLVELVVTLVLVSIIGVVIFSRFLDGNSFNQVIVQDQIISLARVAQQASLGRSGVNLTITPNGAGDSVTLTVAESGGTIQSFTTPLDTVTLTGDINKTASCAVDDGDSAISGSASMVLNFAGLGDLDVSGIGAGTGAITSAVRICINNSAVNSVCVSPAGFAYGGDCDT